MWINNGCSILQHLKNNSSSLVGIFGSLATEFSPCRRSYFSEQQNFSHNTPKRLTPNSFFIYSFKNKVITAFQTPHSYSTSIYQNELATAFCLSCLRQSLIQKNSTRDVDVTTLSNVSFKLFDITELNEWLSNTFS